MITTATEAAADLEGVHDITIAVESPQELAQLVAVLIPLTAVHDGKLANGTEFPAIVCGTFEGHRIIVHIEHA